MRVPEGRLAPIRTPIGSDPEKATMQLLHQTCMSRIDRLNAAGVVGGSSEKYGDQQRFSASTRSWMSSVRQNRYDDIVNSQLPTSNSQLPTSNSQTSTQPFLGSWELEIGS